jgi:hypothetical protein
MQAARPKKSQLPLPEKILLTTVALVLYVPLFLAVCCAHTMATALATWAVTPLGLFSVLLLKRLGHNLTGGAEGNSETYRLEPWSAGRPCSEACDSSVKQFQPAFFLSTKTKL